MTAGAISLSLGAGGGERSAVGGGATPFSTAGSSACRKGLQESVSEIESTSKLKSENNFSIEDF